MNITPRSIQRIISEKIFRCNQNSGLDRFAFYPYFSTISSHSRAYLLLQYTQQPATLPLTADTLARNAALPSGDRSQLKVGGTAYIIGNSIQTRRFLYLTRPVNVNLSRSNSALTTSAFQHGTKDNHTL